MKNIFCVVVGLLASTSAFAKESSWLLCDDGNVVVHVYEQGAVGGHATEAKLIYRGYKLSGLIDESGSTFLAEKYTDTFSGTMMVDYEKNETVVDGYLSFSGEGTHLKLILPCQKMSGRP
ncbi:MAG: hypothetical protein K2X47_08115 [Bdellovibrionales bacterium]|nr:hypothetical protein [Bdellovibrionales bacterium]